MKWKFFQKISDWAAVAFGSEWFFVFHITGDELSVAERKNDATWGMTSRKKFPATNGSSAPPAIIPAKSRP